MRRRGMKYGEIRWKVEKVVFQIQGGEITRKSEIDEGRTLIKKVPDHSKISMESSTAC